MTSEYLWWRDGAIYQIYPRSFQDSNGDGVGDLNGIRQRLDYLESLGIDAIWLSPIYPSPMYDFGYDISDYENVDPVFGTLDDFDALVAEAHARGIRIVLDMVFNHTSHLHPWFLESRSGRDNPKRDWYLWRDPGPDGGPPNNWESTFGGKGWEYDPATGQYYYHQFLKEQPDLNWRNPDVRARVLDVLRFWLARGVDGFRFDVVMSFFKDELFRDNPPALKSPVGLLRAFDRQQHLYDRDRPEMTDVLAEIRALLDEAPGRSSVGEVDDMDMAVRYAGSGRLHMAFNFDFLGTRWLPRLFMESIRNYDEGIAPDAWPCYVLGNHDRDRLASRFGAGPFSDARAKVAAALLLTQRGTPFVYYGDELGMVNTALSRDEILDPPGKLYWPLYQGRDPERTPMQWTDEPYAGFSVSPPWLRVNPDHTRRNVVAQETDPSSVLNTYRALLRLRRQSEALRHGTVRFLIKRPVEGLAYLRETPGQSRLVALNFFGWAIDLKLDGALPANRWKVVFSTATTDVPRIMGNRMRLQPFEAVILEPA
ncbi:MAG: DUF3459 domain-containing protein [Anaerolineales bacterium]|nr:DUF3459 domain-containing protein [Anaerolineales bacterium]